MTGNYYRIAKEYEYSCAYMARMMNQHLGFANFLVKSYNLSIYTGDDIISICNEILIGYINSERIYIVLGKQKNVDHLLYFCRNGVKSVIPSNKIKAWLRTIVLNKIRTLKKKEDNDRKNLDLAKSEYRSNLISNYDFVYLQKTSNSVYYNELYEKINQLNNQEWRRILLLVIQGYSGKEIASFLIKEGYEKSGTDIDKLVVRIRKNKSRALKKLREIYLNNK